MEKSNSLLKAWPLHLTVLGIIVISEVIGTISIPVGKASIMFLPMLFAMVMGIIVYLAKPFKWIDSRYDGVAGKIVVTGIALFMAKIACVAGGSLDAVIKAGPALILQEFGNLGTIFVALPFALLLGFKREAVGMTYSIAREPNVGVIASKYGLDSPEGRGVMTTYTVGTIIGTIFMGLIVSLLSMTPIHPYALAMACGVGSGSMMAASSGTLTGIYPDMAEEITAYAATSNTLSTADAVFMALLIALPLTNFLYDKLTSHKAAKAEKE